MNEGERKSLKKGYPLMYSAIHIRRRIGAPEFFPSLLSCGAINQYVIGKASALVGLDELWRNALSFSRALAQDSQLELRFLLSILDLQFCNSNTA